MRVPLVFGFRDSLFCYTNVLNMGHVRVLTRNGLRALCCLRSRLVISLASLSPLSYAPRKALQHVLLFSTEIQISPDRRSFLGMASHISCEVIEISSQDSSLQSAHLHVRVHNDVDLKVERLRLVNTQLIFCQLS